MAGITFAMRGNTDRCLHGAHSHTPLEIKGHFHYQGPQPVGCEGGAPQWVADLMDQYPDVECVAINRKNGGVVWGRIETKGN